MKAKQRPHKKEGKTSSDSLAFRPWAAGLSFVLALFLAAAFWAYEPNASAGSQSFLGYFSAFANWCVAHLKNFFGLLAPWPILLFFFLAWHWWQKKPLSAGAFSLPFAGGLLCFFSSSAFLALFSAPSGHAGGSFGRALAQGATTLGGSVLAALVLPILILVGFFIAFPGAWARLRSAVSVSFPWRNSSSEPKGGHFGDEGFGRERFEEKESFPQSASGRDLGLTQDPTADSESPWAAKEEAFSPRSSAPNLGLAEDPVAKSEFASAKAEDVAETFFAALNGKESENSEDAADILEECRNDSANDVYDDIEDDIDSDLDDDFEDHVLSVEALSADDNLEAEVQALSVEQKVKKFSPIRKKPYTLPPTSLLAEIPKNVVVSGFTAEELTAGARLLEAKLRDFGVEGRVVDVSSGPVITMYEYQLAPGIKISKVVSLADDLTMAMRVSSIRVVAPLPGKAAIGLEIPNPSRGVVPFRQIVESPEFREAKSLLTMVLGVDIMGKPVVDDLASMPHLLVAGATGAGKSVGLNCMITSILCKATPSQVRFLMIDPKVVEFAFYKDIPHLIYPVLSDPSEATLALKWAVAEMEMRYKLLAENSVRNIAAYNAKIRTEGKPQDPDNPVSELPFLVIIIDELADLMVTAAKEVETYINRLAAKARAAGIHLILATQRPTVDVLTGVIKANLPTRIAFKVIQANDSRTILDQKGAEKLLGKGDMLFIPPGIGKIQRLHGAYVSDQEIENITDFTRNWGPPDYIEDLSTPEAEGEPGGEGERDEKYSEAVELVRRTQRATTSHIQRHLRIGYNRAARIMEDMERDGLIGPQDGTKPRTIF